MTTDTFTGTLNTTTLGYHALDAQSQFSQKRQLIFKILKRQIS